MTPVGYTEIDMSKEHIQSKAKRQVRFTRPTGARLRTTKEFRCCYDAGNRAADSHLLVFATTNVQAHARVGLSVSKKHGNAVRRNYTKRLLREAFRLTQHDMPALDVVLVPRQTDKSTLQDYQASLISLAARLAKQLNGNQLADG